MKYLFLVYMLLFIIIYLIDNYNTKVSIILLSYNRPHNLEKSLPILNKYKNVSEILVFHGHPNYYKEFNYHKVKNFKDYELNKTYGCARRWFHIDKIKNDIVMFLDDDILPSEEFISDGINKINSNNRNTIYGSNKYKRYCNKDGYKSVNKKDNYDTVLTGCSLMNKRIIKEYIDKGFKNYEKWIIKHHGNCEDLGLNLFIRKYYNEKPEVIEKKIEELDKSNGLYNNNNNGSDNHYNLRSDFCKMFS